MYRYLLRQVCNNAHTALYVNKISVLCRIVCCEQSHNDYRRPKYHSDNKSPVNHPVKYIVTCCTLYNFSGPEFFLLLNYWQTISL